MGSFLPKVEPLLRDAETQLSQTPHFGALDPLLTPNPPVSRLDYVRKHSEMLLKVKQCIPGLGLGSSNGFPRTDPQRDDFGPLREWTGLDVCQAWTVLLNAGHLFGTFATERSLLFHLDRELEDREIFIKSAVDFDQSQGNRLRVVVERALNEARLHSFFYLLALWRLRVDGPSSLGEPDRNLARLLIKAFIAPPSHAVGRWIEVFRRTRQLTYMQIHGALRGAKYAMAACSVEGEDLRKLFPTDSLPDADWIARSRWQVLDAIDRHDNVHLFSSTEAAAEVLGHLEAFKPWWNKRRKNGEEFAPLLDQLFSKPGDWEEVRIPYESLVGLRVPSRLDWLTETRLWLRDRNQNDPWDGSNFLVSPDPRGGVLSVDLYAGKNGFHVSALEHCVQQLSRSFAGTHSRDENHLLWMSAARLAARAFQSCFKSAYVIRLLPTSGELDHVGYVSVGDSYEMVRGLVKGFLVSCTDAGRENELRQLLTVADKLTPWRVPAIVILARTLVVDPATNLTMAELDGVCGLFDNGSLRWVVVECKKKDSGDGEKQLREKLAPCLSGPLGVVEHVAHRGHDAWYATITSPHRLCQDGVP